MPSCPASGRTLRYLLTLTIHDAPRPLTVRELVALTEGAGVLIAGRTSKTVSDALRWEVRRGRVRRVARATYGRGQMPRSTAWFMREHLRARLRDHLTEQAGNPLDRDHAA